MARPTLYRNPKFLALCKTLKMNRAWVKGHLDDLWDASHECGNPIFKERDHIELAAGWEGRGCKRGAFASALLAHGFVDELEDGAFAIHDYWDHAPDYVQKRAEREAAREAKGATLSALRAKAGKKGGEANGSKRKSLASDHQANVPTQALAPALALALAPALEERGFASAAPANPPPEEISKPAWMSQHDDVFQDLPRVLCTPLFRNAWMRWEIYQHDKRSRTFQPIQRAPAWSSLLERAPPGKEVAHCVRILNQAMANNWLNFYPSEDDSRGPPGRNGTAGRKAARASTSAPGGGRHADIEAPEL